MIRKQNFWRKNATREKYGNKKVEHAGLWFDSQLEKALFDLLSLKQRAGEIRDLAHHPGTVYLSEARVQYRPDFRFTNCENEEVEYAESKGFETSDWRIKRRLWQSYGPGKLYIYKGSAGRLKLAETLIPSNQGGTHGIQRGGGD